jgi:peptidoglycan L-alanyl-D-glutamate endopeptidase CwlK
MTMTLQEALRQNPSFPCPSEILERQILVTVQFYSFDRGLGDGEIIVDRDLAQDIKDLFDFMLLQKFPIGSVIPISAERFAWDDEISMRANNTSAFNYRTIAGSEKMSNHALGRAIDINPLLNPYIRGEVIQPAGAVYDLARPGTLGNNSPVVGFLKARGWEWGGDWKDLKDYQHFEHPKKN